MFEELLLPIEHFFIQKNHYGDISYTHKEDLFEIVKVQPGKWKCFPEKQIIDTRYGIEIDLKTILKEFPTIKQAQQNFLKYLQPLLSEKDFLDFIAKPKNLHQSEYHDILCNKYLAHQKESLIFLTGNSGNWKLGADEFQTEYYECLVDVFNKQFKTRKHGLHSLWNNIAIHLPELYGKITPEEYTQYKHTILTKTSAPPSSEAQNWWIMFTKPEVDLREIFS